MCSIIQNISGEGMYTSASVRHNQDHSNCVHQDPDRSTIEYNTCYYVFDRDSVRCSTRHFSLYLLYLYGYLVVVLPGGSATWW